MVGFADEAEDIPYRAPATAPVDHPDEDQDDQDYSTLVRIQKDLDKSIEELKFDLTNVKDDNETDLQVEVRARKIAYDIIGPIKQMVDSAITNVEQKRKGKV